MLARSPFLLHPLSDNGFLVNAIRWSLKAAIEHDPYRIPIQFEVLPRTQPLKAFIDTLTNHDCYASFINYLGARHLDHTPKLPRLGESKGLPTYRFRFFSLTFLLSPTPGSKDQVNASRHEQNPTATGPANGPRPSST